MIEITPLQSQMFLNDKLVDPKFFPLEEKTTDEVMVDPDHTLSQWDVLSGRGKTAFNHIGNRRFRVLVNNHLDAYLQASSRVEKAYIVGKIVNSIRDAGGYFLKKDAKTGAFYDIGDKSAREKAGHALRDAHAERLRNEEDEMVNARASERKAKKAAKRARSNSPKPKRSTLSKSKRSVSKSPVNSPRAAPSKLTEPITLENKVGFFDHFAIFPALNKHQNGVNPANPEPSFSGIPATFNGFRLASSAEDESPPSSACSDMQTVEV